MSIESASNFLVGSILLSVGILVFVAAAVAINNLLFRFWKPVKIFSPDSWKAFNPPVPQVQGYNDPVLVKETK